MTTVAKPFLSDRGLVPQYFGTEAPQQPAARTATVTRAMFVGVGLLSLGIGYYAAAPFNAASAWLALPTIAPQASLSGARHQPLFKATIATHSTAHPVAANAGEHLATHRAAKAPTLPVTAPGAYEDNFAATSTSAFTKTKVILVGSGLVVAMAFGLWTLCGYAMLVGLMLLEQWASSWMPWLHHRMRRGTTRGGNPRWAMATVGAETTAADSATSNAVGEKWATLSQYNWARQWYPVGWCADLPTDVIHKVTLFDTDYVVVRSGTGAPPTALLDRCPHRLAALSEGRVTAQVCDPQCPHNPHPQLSQNGADSVQLQ